jgi:hypothetical protein
MKGRKHLTGKEARQERIRERRLAAEARRGLSFKPDKIKKDGQSFDYWWISRRYSS